MRDIADVVKRMGEDPTFAEFVSIMQQWEKDEISDHEAAKLAADVMTRKLQSDIDDGKVHEFIYQSMLKRIEEVGKGGSNRDKMGEKPAQKGGKASTIVMILLWGSVVVQGITLTMQWHNENFPLGFALAWLIFLILAATTASLIAAWGVPGRVYRD